jgi:hypothetical protein
MLRSQSVSDHAGQPSPYIVGRCYDWLFFLLPPTLALGLGILVSHTAFSERTFSLAGQQVTWQAVLIETVIHAHLVAVFFRSHANPPIFRRHPVRFVIVPMALWVILCSSARLAAASLVVATFWDVWHSGAQTFGLARIYERNQGNPPQAGRMLDFWLNQLLYAGPILGGVTMFDHFESFTSFEQVGAVALSKVPAFMQSTHRYWTWGVLAVGTLFVLVYIGAHVRLWRRGYHVSWLKIWLVCSTGVCSVYTWGFNSWGEAFFIMNLFHAVQYLGLVWATEGQRLCARTGLAHKRFGIAAGAAVFGSMVFAYGVAATLVDTSRCNLWAITMVVSLMHFWYDGFVWSVKRRQI